VEGFEDSTVAEDGHAASAMMSEERGALEGVIFDLHLEALEGMLVGFDPSRFEPATVLGVTVKEGVHHAILDLVDANCCKGRFGDGAIL
jgi:hypothetical protein